MYSGQNKAAAPNGKAASNLLKAPRGGEEVSFNLDMEEIQKMMDADLKEAGKLRDVNKAFDGWAARRTGPAIRQVYAASGGMASNSRRCGCVKQ